MVLHGLCTNGGTFELACSFYGYQLYRPSPSSTLLCDYRSRSITPVFHAKRSPHLRLRQLDWRYAKWWLFADARYSLSLAVKTIIGIYAERLVFLNVNNWVCSIELGSAEAVCSRHFFIPNDWVSLVRELIFDVGPRGEILFVKRADIAIIRRGLETTEKGVPIPRKRSEPPQNFEAPAVPLRAISH